MPIALTGNIVDLIQQKIQYGEVLMEDGMVVGIREMAPEKAGEPYILPGFIDSHVHIESSMLVPSEFARLAVVHGTVATISDPHEIANVCGLKGVEYMIDNGKTVPFKFHFGAPSCVPATTFETAGAALDVSEVTALLERKEIHYLSEMMNFPGVLNSDKEVMEKIAAAHRNNKPVDGHAPGLMGELAARYIGAGISTDHECFTAEEALNKIELGMKILIREGSAARNFEALIDLLEDHPNRMMFCSDDKHPDSLVEGHINLLCQRAIAKGIDRFHVLKAACLNPVRHYQMNVGLLQPGDPGDCIVVKDLVDFNVLQTYINGALVAEQGKSLIEAPVADSINHFHCDAKVPEDFVVPFQQQSSISVIEALEGQLITHHLQMEPLVMEGKIVSDVDRDLLKIVVVNRYQPAPAAIAFVKNFGLKQGAIASTVAHDSHNIIAVGVDDDSICKAVNLVIAKQGGISAVVGMEEHIIGLPVAGLMSNDNGYSIAEAYTNIDAFVKQTLGSTLAAPFMTLSFMALLVIPHLKLSDKGLFDGDTFSLMSSN